MLSTEDLNHLWLKLSASPKTTASLRNELDGVFESAPYRQWHQAEPKTRFKIDQQTVDHLREVALVNNSELQVKVNRIGKRIFITDGAWVSHLMRVFPDPDEALVLLKYVEENGLSDWPDWIIDPGAGCGHTPLGFAGRARRISCDVNVRALLYASINGALNEMPPDQFLPFLNNMKNGFPSSLKLEGKVMFLANVPFAPAPREGALALNSAGGETGADLQLASFRMMDTFKKLHHGPVSACFLTWTVGSKEKDEWEVPELCRNLFPQAQVKWTMLNHEYDAPELPNPAPLHEMLMHLATSQYAIDPLANNVKEEFMEHSEKLQARGYTHIAYGMLECRFEKA